jgi:hypothetical protein
MAMQPGQSANQPGGAATGAAGFPALGARRLLVLGGLALILAGMVLGDIFAVFVLHQNAARISEGLLSATGAVVIHDRGRIPDDFAAIGGLLENRGTKVDAHVHIIDFGYLALLFALVQPWVLLSERWKKRLAWLLVIGAALLPVGVFLIHYVGLAYSPLEAIGLASIFADFGGLLVLLASFGELVGLWKYLRRPTQTAVRDALLADRSWAGRALLAGGTALILAGFLHGSYYAGVLLYGHEARDAALLSTMTSEAAANHPTAAAQAVADYGNLQGEKAVNIAAHAHIIEFGMLAMLMAFFQPFVFLAERWKRVWAVVLLAGSAALPVFVLLELHWGLIAGGLADAGGLLVIVALLGMLVGVLRYTGRLDAAAGGAR